MENLKLKIKNLKKKFNKLEKLLIKSNLNYKKYKVYNKKYNKIKKILNFYIELKKYKSLKLESINLLKFEEIKDLALDEIKLCNVNLKILYKKLKNFFYKKSNIKSFFLEIRIGVGGEESAIFVSDLYKMYTKYIEKNNWNYKLLSSNPTNIGGYKDILLLIKNKKAYNNLKLESGVHRVQRLPKTENKGRIHTSTCKVAIIPKLNKIVSKFKKEDFKIETFKSSGAGGQHVNKTNSAVRIKHIPTGLVVECQNERSQHKNKNQALNILKSKIFNLRKQNLNLKKNKLKKFLLGKGERSEKIRTYNYKKNRFTDHRVNFTNYKLDYILEGNLNEVIKIIKFKIKNSVNVKKN